MRQFFQVPARVHNATIILTFIAKTKEKPPIPLSLVSKYLKLSYRYLEQIMMDLKKAGLVESFRGAAGGYKLNRKSISMLDVIEAIEGPINIMHCIGNKKCKIEHRCPSKDVWPKFQTEIIKVLKSIKIV